MARGSKKAVLTRGDITKMSLRTLLNQATFNYERMQSIGFTAAMAPELEKIYEDDPKMLAKVAEDNLEFINTHNVTLAFLIGLMLSLYEKGEKPETVRSVKVSLFGPLAGIGDAIFWFTLMPIMSGITASLANSGSVLGPILYFVVFFAVFLLRIPLGHIGYSTGTKAFDVISKNAEKFNRAATILAITILGGLIASYINIEVLTEITAGETTIGLQADFFDKILPNILPLGFTMAIFGLLKKKVSPTILIVSILALAILLSFFGIL